jgi:hypothetical protein
MQKKLDPSTRGASIRALAPLVLGLVIGVASLQAIYTAIPRDVDHQNLALGKETSSHFAVENGVAIHCFDMRDATRCIDGYRATSTDKVVLWLGNSQVHAINQTKPGDTTAAAILHRRLRPLSRYFLTFSEPNANLQEHYVLFEYLLTRLPISTLVLPVVFDDTRETDIRATLSAIFADAETRRSIGQSDIGKTLIRENTDSSTEGTGAGALHGTVQEHVEEKLNAALERRWRLWADRVHLQNILVAYMHGVRNTLFGITPTSIRRVIPGRYLQNMQALEATLAAARRANVTVLIYVAPIRNDVSLPYDLHAYDKFKAEVEALADKSGATFLNLESVVPPAHWGRKDASSFADRTPELDFMHFQAAGHAILADALYAALLKTLEQHGARK